MITKGLKILFIIVVITGLSMWSTSADNCATSSSCSSGSKCESTLKDCSNDSSSCTGGACSAGAVSRKVASNLSEQTLCPVMKLPVNKELYADVNGKRVYVCCQGCISQIKAEPEKWLNELEKSGQKAEAISNNLSEQTLCPVMKNPVNKSLYADVNGKRVYVCCGGCISQIKSNPEKWLNELEKMGQKAEIIE